MNDFIAHFGIQGMKWGVRRFQNEDGTRTEAGKERYSKATKRNIRKAMERNNEGWFTKTRRTIGGPDSDHNDKNRKIALEKQKKALKPYEDARKAAWQKEDRLRWKFHDKYEKEPTDVYYDAYVVNDPGHKERVFKENGIDEKKYKQWVKDYEKYIVQSKLAQGPSLVFAEMYNQYAKEHAEEWLGATLQDIGIENTQKGRDLLKKMYPNIAN